MALSDYLTENEWDACFYAYFGQHCRDNFGSSMHKTINKLLGVGYRFDGLDANGDKKRQVENGINAPKVCIFLGNPHNCDVLKILDNGRNFLKENYSALVDETDGEWQEQMKLAKKKIEMLGDKK